MSVPSIENVVQVGAKDVGTEGMSWLDHVVCCQCGVGTVLYSLNSCESSSAKNGKHCCVLVLISALLR